MPLISGGILLFFTLEDIFGNRKSLSSYVEQGLQAYYRLLINTFVERLGFFRVFLLAELPRVLFMKAGLAAFTNVLQIVLFKFSIKCAFTNA